MTVEADRHGRNYISIGTDVSALTIGEVAQVVGIVHSEEVHAYREIPVIGPTPDSPVRAGRAIEARIIRHVHAGNVLTASLQVPSPAAVSRRDLQFACVCNDAAPDITVVRRTRASFITQPGV